MLTEVTSGHVELADIKASVQYFDGFGAVGGLLDPDLVIDPLESPISTFFPRTLSYQIRAVGSQLASRELAAATADTNCPRGVGYVRLTRLIYEAPREYWDLGKRRCQLTFVETNKSVWVSHKDGANLAACGAKPWTIDLTQTSWRV